MFSTGSSCAALPLQLCSAPPTARWSNSVLSTALNPIGLAQKSTMTPLWEVVLFPHPSSQLCSLSCLHLLRVWPLASSPFLEAIPMFHPTQTTRLQCTVYAFWLYSEQVQSAQGFHWIMSQEGIRELHIVHLAHLLYLQIYAVSFETGRWREMAPSFLKEDT
jgi:hypothetical protein